MKIIPEGKEMLGRRVEIVRTQAGIVLPDSQNQGVTKFVLIDAVGDGVTKYKPEQIVLPHHLNFIHLRGGFTRVLCNEDEIRASIELTPQERAALSIEGGEPTTPSNGERQQQEVQGEPV